ncbi:MAG TPA: hypothetical protein VIL22_05310 [Paenibacillaceae bacterium]
MDKKGASADDLPFEGKEKYELDVDRMVNEGLGGGRVTEHNGYIGDTTVEPDDFAPMSGPETAEPRA